MSHGQQSRDPLNACQVRRAPAPDRGLGSAQWIGPAGVVRQVAGRPGDRVRDEFRDVPTRVGG
ncbi:hypothetical protein ADL05_09845 [Nocardiopsis sp. NRRL B-16309]|nr:hypothetical protein ADL05_09845 [Nocardiopsis sp. NRRL B-16309]